MDCLQGDFYETNIPNVSWVVKYKFEINLIKPTVKRRIKCVDIVVDQWYLKCDNSIC